MKSIFGAILMLCAIFFILSQTSTKEAEEMSPSGVVVPFPATSPVSVTNLTQPNKLLLGDISSSCLKSHMFAPATQPGATHGRHLVSIHCQVCTVS